MVDDVLFKELTNRFERLPIWHTMRFQLLEMGHGYCKVKSPLDTSYQGVYHTFHGGQQATVADSIACVAICTMTGVQQHMTTTDIAIRYLAPCFTDITAHAQVIKKGRTLCPVRVDLFDDHGTMVSTALVTYMLIDRAPRL